MSPTFLVFQLMNGITFAALLFLLASGFTLIFGLMRVVNLIHGALYLVGGYLDLSAIRATGSFPEPSYFAIFGPMSIMLALGPRGLSGRGQ